jgi:hypothetical protein
MALGAFHGPMSLLGCLAKEYQFLSRESTWREKPIHRSLRQAPGRINRSSKGKRPLLWI